MRQGAGHSRDANRIARSELTLTETNEACLRASGDLLEQKAKASLLRRLLPAADVAPTTVFLGSASNTAVTGEIIRAGGGIT